jgi:hypothetical protein
MIDRDQHDSIRRIAARMDIFLAKPTPPDGDEFARLRWTLVRELSIHLAVERPALTTWLQRNAGRAAELDTDFDQVFAHHMATWSGANIHAAWADYRGVTADLLARLRRRMDYEERVISGTPRKSWLGVLGRA